MARTNSTADIVVVGGGVAAGYFCHELGRCASKWSVIVVSNESYYPYERPALTKGYLVNGGMPVENFATCVGSGKDKLNEEYYKNHKIEFMLGSTVTGIEVESKKVYFEGGATVTAAKALILAMGSRPTTLEDFNMKMDHIAQGIFYVRDVADTDKLISYAKALPKQSNIVIIGGGYIGMETAAGLLNYGHNITMVFPESKVMDRFMTSEMASFYEGRYQMKGINIIKEDLIVQLSADTQNKVESVTLRSGRCLPSDLVIVGVGARPNVELIKGQLELLSTPPGGIIVDGDMRTNVDDVYVIGELAAHRLNEKSIRRYEHVQYARETASRAAQVLNAMSSGVFTYYPYFYSRVLDLAWVLYGETPTTAVNVYYKGDLSPEGNGHFAVFWVDGSNRVVGGFLEGGTKEQVAELSLIVREHRSWPLNHDLISFKPCSIN